MSRFRIPRAAGATLDATALLEGELAHDTTNDELRLGDGVTLGGKRFPNAASSGVNISAAVEPVLEAATLALAQSAFGVRRNLTANLTLTYDPAGGADFTTLADAVAYIQTLDPRGYTVTVNGPSTTTAVSERLIIPNDFGWGCGEQYTPGVHFNLAHCDFTHASYSCIAVIGGRVKITTKSIACTSSSYAAVQCADDGKLTLIPGSFGACTTGHMQAANGYIVLPSAYTIAGSAPYHALAESSNGLIELPDATITVSGTPAFSDSFVQAGEHGNIKAFASTAFSGSATGVKWKEHGGGRVTANDPAQSLDALFPGDTAGIGTVRATNVEVLKGDYKHVVTSAATANRTLGLPDASGTAGIISTGTFTPAFTFVTPGDVANVYTLQAGDYIKINQLVFIRIRLAWTPTHTTASGVAQITGLPFTAKNSSGNTPLSVALSNVLYAAGQVQAVGRVGLNTAILNIAFMDSEAAFANGTTANFPTGVAYVVEAAGWYEAA